MRPTQSIPSALPGEATGAGQVVRTSQAVLMSLPGLNAEPRAGAAATSAARSEETAAAARAAARPQAEATGNTVSQAPARRPIYHLRPMGGRRGFRAAAHPDQRQDQRQEHGPDQRQNQAAAAVPAAESPSAATVPAAASAAGPGVRAAGPASAGTGIGTLSGTVPGVVVGTGEEVSPEVLALAACDIPAELATGEEAAGALDRSFDFSDQAAVPIVPEGTTMVVEEDVVLTGSKRRSTRSARTVQKKAARKPTRRKTGTGTTGTRRRTSTRSKAAATAAEMPPEQSPDQMAAHVVPQMPDPVVPGGPAPSPAEGSGAGMTVAGYPDAAQDAAQETAFQPAFQEAFRASDQEAARQAQAQAAIPRRPTFARDDEGQLRRLRQRLSAPYADSLFPELEAEEAARAARSRDAWPAESEDRGVAGRVPAAGAPVPESTGPAGSTDEADHRERARTREPAWMSPDRASGQRADQTPGQTPGQTPAQATWAARADSRPQAAGPVSQEPASDRTASPEADVRSTEQGTDQSTDQAPEQPAEEAQAGQSAALRRRLPILSGCSHRLLIVLVLIVLGIGAIGMFLMQSQTDPRGPVTGRLPDRLTDRSRPSASVPADRNGTVPVTAPGLVPGTAAPDSYGLHGTQDADRPAGLTAQEWAEILSADEQNEDNSADDLGASRETSLEVSREAGQASGQASEPLAAAEQGADDTSASSGDSADPAGRATAEEKARQMRQFALELRLLRLTTQDTMALLARVEEALGRQEDVSGDAGQPDASGAREAAEADLIRLLDRCEILGVQMRQWALRSRALVLAEDEFSRELARRAARALAARAAQAPDTASTETASDAHTALLSGVALTAAAPAASSREPAGKAAGRAQSPQVLPEDDRNTQQKAPDSEQQTVQKETRKEARKDSAKADSGREVNRTKQEKKEQKQKAQARTVREKKERARTNARAKAQAGKSVPLALRGWTVAGIGDNRAVLADPEGRAWTVVAGGRTTDFRVLAIDLAGHRVLTDKGPLSFAGSGTNRSGKKDFGKKDSGKKDSGRQGPGVN